MTQSKRDVLLIVVACHFWLLFYSLVIKALAHPIYKHVIGIAALAALPFYIKKIIHEITHHAKLANFKKSWGLTLLSDIIYLNPVAMLILIVIAWRLVCV